MKSELCKIAVQFCSSSFIYWQKESIFVHRVRHIYFSSSSVQAGFYFPSTLHASS